MSQPVSAVVAGSKGFVDAVQGHLKMRFGSAPQVARDPQEVLRACAEKGGLLVLEYAGSPWLDAVKNLRGLCGDAALSIVAAVPIAQAADVQPLQRAGVDEVVSWQGRVDPVIWAVDRIVDRQSALKSTATRSEPEASTEGETGFELREIPPSDLPATSTPIPVLSSATRSAAIPPALVPTVPWPDAVPSAVEAEALLVSVLAGRASGDASQRVAAERVLATASDLERTALSGAEVPVDPVLLRAAAALRLRLDLALTSLPAAAGAVNQPAANQLLVDVDGLLGQMKTLAASAPAGAAPVLEPIRLSLVDAGVELTGALSGLVPETQPPVPSAPAKAPAARILSNERSNEDTPLHRRIALWVALVLALAGATAFHANRYLHPAKPSGPGHFPGSPEGSVAAPGAGQRTFVMSPAGRFEPSEVEKFKVEQELKGNTVRQLAPGTLVVVPGLPPIEVKRGGP
jgi:hypothetical protein